MIRVLHTPARAFALVALIAVTTLLYAPSAAQAHPADDWYHEYRWPLETVHEFSYQESFPAAYRAAAGAGVEEWNTNGTELTPQFYSTLPDSDFPVESPCMLGNSAVFWEDQGAVYLGSASRCVSSSLVVSQFRVVMNSYYSWYAGTGTPPSGQYDLTAVVAHEFGHVTAGWSPNHWNQGPHAEASLCLANSDKHTMCSTLNSGVTWQRHLREHEIHTFQEAYLVPPPSCEVDYTIGSSWPGNVQVALEVHNNTSGWINGWTAEWTFTGDEDVFNSWGVDISQSGPDATATSTGFGDQVPPGGSVTVGFQATVTGTPTVPQPISCDRQL